MNATNGRIEVDPIESRGGPPAAVTDGVDANKLAAAKDAAKKKLLRLVVQQAAEELGDPDAIVEQAFRDGLFSEELISGLRAGVRDRMTRRLIDHIAQEGESGLAADAVLALADAPEVLAAVDSVERKLAGTIAAKALERMEDEAAIADSIFDQIARVNDETMTALSDDVRGLVVQSIADRAWASSVDPDEILKIAETRVDPDDPAIEAAVVEIRKAAIVRIQTLVDQEFSAPEFTTGLAEEAARRVEDRLLDRVRDEILTNGMESRVSESITESISSRIAESVFETGALLKRVEERLGDDSARMQEAAERARAEFAVHLTDDLIAAVTADAAIDSLTAQAVAEVRVRAAQDVCARVTALPVADLIDEALARMADSGILVNEASERLIDVLSGNVARLAETELRSEGVNFDHPTVSAVMLALQSDVQVAIAERAYQTVADSDTRAQLAADIAARVHDAVTSDALKGILGRNPAEMAQAIAAQISEDEPVIARATESVMASLRADVARSVVSRIDAAAEAEGIARSVADGSNAVIGDLMHSVAESLREYAKDRAIEEVASSASISEITASGYDVLRDRLVVSIAQRSASVEAADLAGEAASLIGESPLVAEEAATLLHARMVESIAAKAVDQLGSVAAASEKARVIAESDDTVVEDAVRTVYDLLASQVGEEVTRRIRQTDRLAQAAASFVDPDDPAVEAAATDVTNDLGRLVAVRAVDQLSSVDGRARIVAEATGACSDEMENSVHEAEDRLMQTIVTRIAARFTDAGDTARRAQEKLGADHAPLIAAGEVLKELVLEELSRKATIMLLDASQAADRAFSRIDLDDPRFQRAQDTLRTRIVDAVAERSLQALEDVESAAGMVRARIPEDHEHVVGTAALVRDMLLDDIARRSEASLNDTRTAARLSRQRVPENSVNLTSASEALRDLLLDDLVHLATSAFGDAAEAAEQAMRRVDGDEDVLVRARAAFKERILMSVLGEAIREIGGAFGSGRADAQQAVFQQAMTAMARQSGAFQPAPDRSPMPDTGRPASSEEAYVPFVPASEVSGTPSDAAVGTGETPRALRTAALPSMSDEGWTRLSDLVDHETEAVQAEDSVAFRSTEELKPETKRPAPPVDHPDLIVTEFIEMDPDESDEDEDEVEEEGPFVFAWAAEDVQGGDSMSPIHGVEEPVASVRVEPSGDGASNPRSSVQLPWDEDGDKLAYVYGFLPNDEASLPLGSSLIGMDPASPVRFVTVRGVRAITSMVSTDEFSPDAMSKRSQDTGWLRERIRIHARVLDAFKSTTTVVPLRFGCIYENEADVAAMIEARYSRITETLDRLAGRMEWGVRAVRNLDRLRNRVLQTERTIDESLASLSTGVAQFVRDEMSKSTDLEEASLIETVTRHCLTRVDEALSRWAEDGAEKSLVPSHTGDVVMNRAYLVEQTAVDDFRAELTRLGAEFESIGLAFEMTGPWPAFHFSSFDDDHLAGTVPAHG